jgi:hypothetical protein
MFLIAALAGGFADQQNINPIITLIFSTSLSLVLGYLGAKYYIFR